MKIKTSHLLWIWIFGLSLFTSSVSAQTAYEPVIFTVDRFEISGDNPIGENKAQKVLQPYLGEQAGLEGLSAAADALEQAVIKAGYSFHRVSLPPQELTAGTVKFEILRFSIGNILVSGNQYFDQANIENSLPLLQSGTTPNTKSLSRSLKLANNHASKNLVLRFKEGEQGDSIDADIKVQDMNPQIFFVTLDNTGTEETEDWRSTIGYQHGNLFNIDHSLTATLTFAPQEPSSTTQIGLNYHIPMYQHGANLDMLFSDSEVNSGETGDSNEVTGKGQVLGVTYTKPMLTDTNFDHHWSVGAQYKKFDNQVGSLDLPVDSFPLILGYGFKYSGRSWGINGGLNFNLNTGVGSNNTDEDYDTASQTRTKDTDWSSIQYSLSYDLAFAKQWLFHAGLSGQNSSDLLISGEQFGVGGSRSLRGFEERSVAGDSGYQLNLEIWSPAFWGGVRYLFFIDQGSVEVNDSPVTPSVKYDLASWGVGVRWSWKQQLSVNLDIGVISKGLGPDEGINSDPNADDINLDDDTKAHFSLVYRF